MDLRKGSQLEAGKRRCIRCRGRKKLYKVRGAWSFDNSGGTLTDCPMCLGKGVIDQIPFTKIDEAKPEDIKDAKKKRTTIRDKKIASLEKEY